MTSPLADHAPPGYVPVALLGQGAFGVVLEATDPQGRRAAVKAMAPEAARRPEAVWQFLGEHRRLARLRHPAFPEAFEAGTLPDGRPYYAMALAAGSEPAGPLPADRVRAVLVGAAEALAFLHRQGWVHGDLKPENLRVAEDGAVVLLDVGLMAPAGQRREAVAGTLEYLAPEAFRLAPVAPAADLYALGALGHALWAGAPPFPAPKGGQASAAAELVRAHLHATPPAPPDAAADPALARLLADLLAKDPARRPASAAAVLAALGRPLAAADAAPAMLRGGAFVGRGDALAAWEQALATDGAAWLALVGAPGAGKSRALDELRLQAQATGKAWIGAACAQAAGAPAAPLRAVVAQALALAGREPAAATAAWLGGAIPEALRELEPPARTVALRAAAAADLAAAAGALGGLAVALDDWHLADEAGRAFLAFLGGLEPAPPITWALALDPAAPDLEAIARRSARVDLAPLDADCTHALLAARLGAPPPAALEARLAEVAGGNPALLDLTLEHLVASGALRPEGEGWALAEGAAGADLPVGLAAIWRARLEALPHGARRLAAALAVAAPAGALPAPAFAVALGMADGALAEAAEALQAVGMARGEGGRLRLAAPEVAGPAVEGVGAEERRAWAEVWVAGLLSPAPGGGTAPQAQGGGPTERVAGWLPAPEASLLSPPQGGETYAAARLALAEDLPAAGALAAEAGRLAMAAGAAREALPLLEAAEARLAADAAPAVRLAVLLPLAEALRFADRVDDAVTRYEAVAALAAEAGEPGVEARARIGYAKGRQLRGAYPEAAAAYEAAAEAAARAGEPAQRARAAASLARMLIIRGDAAGADAWCTRAAAEAELAGSAVMRAQALVVRGLITVMADPARAPEAREVLEEALAIARAVGDRVTEVQATDNLANAHLAVGDLAAATEAFRAVGALARGHADATEALMADLNLALALGERGRLADAARLAADVARRAEAAGRRYVLGAARSVEAQAAWRAGDALLGQAKIADALGHAEAIGNAVLEEHARLYALELALLTADPAATEADLARLAALAQRTRHAEAELRAAAHAAEMAWQVGDASAAAAAAWPLLEAPNRVAAHQAHRVATRAALAAGMVEEAHRHVDAAWTIAEGWDAAWHVAADVALQARVAEAGAGGRAAAIAFAEAAIRLAGAPSGPNPYAAAEAAGVLARLGHVEDAQAAVAAAGAAFAGWLDALEPEARARFWRSLGWDEPPAPPQAHAAPAAGVVDAVGLAEVVEDLAGATDEAAIGAIALQGAMGLVGAERGYLLAYEDGRLKRAVTWGIGDEAELAEGFSASIASRALFTGEPVYVADAVDDPAWREAASVMALSLRTVVALPLAVPDRTLGVLYMDREDPEPALGPADLALLRVIATSAAAAIARTREAAQARAEAAAARACADLGRALAGLAPPDRRARVLEAARAAVGADAAYWLVRDGDGWRAAVTSQGDAAGPDFGAVSRGVVDHVAATGTPLAILDVAEAEAWRERASVQALGLRTVWAVPAGADVVYMDAARADEGDPTAALPLAAAIVAYGAGF